MATKGLWVGEHFYFDPPGDESVGLQTIIVRGLAASLGGALRPTVSAEAEAAAAAFVATYRADMATLREAETRLLVIQQVATLVADGGEEHIKCSAVTELLGRALDGQDACAAAVEVVERAKQPY